MKVLKMINITEVIFLIKKKKRKKILNASFYFELRQTKIQASATSEVNIA